MRVFWTEEEKQKLVELVFTMRQNDLESSLLAIVNRAQEQLPAERRRTIPSIKAIDWLPIELKKRMDAVKNRAAMSERAAQSARDSKSHQIELQEKLQNLVEVTKNKTLETTPVENLALELLARMLGPMEEIRRQLSGFERRIARLEEQPEPVAAEKRILRILLVGLLPDQVNNVRARFREAVDVRALDKDDPCRGIPVVDAAVLNTKFISHSMQQDIQRAYNGHGKVFFVNGGLSAVIERIEKLLQESA